MLSKFFNTRYSILPAIIAFYFIPLALLSIYGAIKVPLNQSFSIASIGLFCSVIGTLILFVILKTWEEQLIEASGFEVAHENQLPNERKIALNDSLLEETKLRCDQLEEELKETKSQLSSFEEDCENKKQELTVTAKEKENLQKDQELLIKELEQLKISTEEKLEQNHIFVNEYQKTIHEQRSLIENKQQQIAQLESKVRDLTYEIKTLLQLAEKAETFTVQDRPSSLIEHSALAENGGLEPYFARQPIVSTREQASKQLKHCIEIAQKITGVGHYGSRLSKIRDLSIDNYSLDLRHLSENFNNENSCVVFLYSQKENKLLFINKKIKEILEWTQEKTIQNFVDIISNSTEEWNQLLSQLSYKNEVSAELALKAKNGKFVSVNCHLGVIPTGLFRSNTIGILYV